MSADPVSATEPAAAELASGAEPRVRPRQVYECREWGEVEVDVGELLSGNDLKLYASIEASKYLAVRVRGRRVVFAATHYVGHIPLNDHVALSIKPRFGIASLTRLLQIAHHSPVVLDDFVRSYERSAENLPVVSDQLAMAFAASVERIVLSGLVTTYDRREESTSFPTGRVLLGATAIRSHARGEKYRARCAWWQRSLDSPTNRLIKRALWLADHRIRSSQARAGLAKLRTRLNRCYRAFESVRLVRRSPTRRELEPIPSNRAYYLPAVELALLLANDEGIDLASAGAVRLPSMLVNLQAAFECYLRNILASALAADRRWSVLDGNLSPPEGGQKKLFDDNSSHPATPDITVVQQDPLACVLLVEVKYKDRPSREDINQAITYAATYRCKVVVLAHVRLAPDDVGLRLIGTVGSVATVYGYAFDLSASLAPEEARFALAMQGLLCRDT